MELSHLKRWLTSIAAIPVLLVFLIKAPPAPFAAFIALIAVISLFEYHRIVNASLNPRAGTAMTGWGLLSALFLLYTVHHSGWTHAVEVILISSLGAGVLSIILFTSDQAITEGIARQVQGLIYIPLALSTLILLRTEPNGVRWVFFLLFVVFPGDVGGFYAGRLFGKHKLSPVISPGKTVEGAMGNLVVSIVVGFSFMLIFLPELPVLGCLLLFVLISLFGQSGDLFESELKRVRNVKDSGRLLPGHGGLLDRIDALLFAAPVAYLYKNYILIYF
jgi:phosphatidate cytidylyltransferase